MTPTTRRTLIALSLALWSSTAAAQVISQRGFVDVRSVGFLDEAPNDPTKLYTDLLAREEVFLKPSQWFRLEGGIDFRANSNNQVDDDWALDFEDRRVKRPRFATRRAAAVVTAGKLTIEAGKQFIRWGRADVLNPTDRFAPRDYVNVLDADFLPVLGVHPTLLVGTERLEGVWSPRLTPSRLPLFDQRWVIVPAEAAGIRPVDTGYRIPDRSQFGVRWTHTGEKLEMSLDYFDGMNHLPNLEFDVQPALGTALVKRIYPRLRTYGGDIGIPTHLFTLKGEAAYFSSPDDANNEYVIYVVEIERQVGEWIFVGGYAGDVSVTDRGVFAFAPDRGIAKSVLARVSYTVDPRRTVTFEAAARQSGDGFYLKGEFSQAIQQHWRVTAAGVLLAGRVGDFIGQFNRNSNGSIGLRFSF